MEIFYNIVGWAVLGCLIAYTVFSIIKLIIDIRNRIKSKKEVKKE